MRADCQFCHGINGDGRGDPRSPGRAANLRETRLNREQLIEVIACGRPGTEMPHFGLGGKDLGTNAPRLPAFGAVDQTRDRGSRRLHHHGIRRKIATVRDCDRQSPRRGASR